MIPKYGKLICDQFKKNANCKIKRTENYFKIFMVNNFSLYAECSSRVESQNGYFYEIGVKVAYYKDLCISTPFQHRYREIDCKLQN